MPPTTPLNKVTVSFAGVSTRWSPEEPVEMKAAAEKTPEEDDIESCSSRAEEDASEVSDFIPIVRGGRSKSLTEAKSVPMLNATPEQGEKGLKNSVMSSVCSTIQQPPSVVLVRSTTETQSSNTTRSPITSSEEARRRKEARALRRAMSAEFSLSMLQQELGYPRRKLSSTMCPPGQPLSRENRRRGSSVLEDSIALRASGGGNEEGDEEIIVRRSTSDRSSITSQYNQLEPEPEGGENDLDDDDEENYNFLDYRVASVTGYSRDADGIVYYEILVKSIAHGPLSAYKVRRRYSEFRELHHSLSKVMPRSKKSTLSELQLSPVGSVCRQHSYSSDEEELSQSPEPSTSLLRLQKHKPEICLPPLPDKGGLWSYLQFDSTPLLERRARYFHAMLVAAQNHEGARESRLLNDFLGTPPDSVALNSSVDNTYVSLNRFAAPKLSLSIEFQERKDKARKIRTRRSSIPRINQQIQDAIDRQDNL